MRETSDGVVDGASVSVSVSVSASDPSPGPVEPQSGRATERVARGRVVAIDLGSKRTGVAVCDSGRTLASPRTTMVRSGDAERDIRAIVDLVVEEEATAVVVGHPLSLDGSRGRAALAAEAEAELLRRALEPHGVTVELFDERLTTVTAHQSLQAGGMSGRDRRMVVDRSAATVLLQAWLELARRIQ